MSKPIFILDMDGCIAGQGKIWHEWEERIENPPSDSFQYRQEKRLGVYKQISDHDSWAIDTVKKHAHICILSGDKRINEAWAKRRGVDFVYTCAKGFHQDKWDHLQEYRRRKFGPQPYYYLGDASPDFKCMQNASAAFYPADACFALKRLIRDSSLGAFHELKRESGYGCFEEMLDTLIGLEYIPEIRTS